MKRSTPFLALVGVGTAVNAAMVQSTHPIIGWSIAAATLIAAGFLFKVAEALVHLDVASRAHRLEEAIMDSSLKDPPL